MSKKKEVAPKVNVKRQKTKTISMPQAVKRQLALMAGAMKTNFKKLMIEVLVNEDAIRAMRNKPQPEKN